MLAWICASLCCHEQTYGLVFGGKQAGWAAQVWLPMWEVCLSGGWRACLRSDSAARYFWRAASRSQHCSLSQRENVHDRS